MARGTAFPNTDFAAFARACGVDGFTARTPDALPRAIREWLASPGPAVLDVFVDPDELPTMPHIEPAKALRFGIGKVKEFLLGGA